MLKRLTIILPLIVAMPLGVMADDLALVITNGNYRSGVSSRAVSRLHADLTDSYLRQGYEVIEGRNLDAGDMREALESFLDRMDGKDRIVVHFSGRAVNLEGQTWLLPIGVSSDSLLDVDYNAPSLGVILEVLGERPGRGMLFVGEYEEGRVDAPLDADIDAVDVPQGVLFVHGAEDDLNDFIVDDLLRDDGSIATVLDRNGDDLIVEGFASPDISMVRSDDVARDTPDDEPSDWAELLAEQTLWAVADRSGTQEDLEAYLDRFPTGLFAQVARAKLEGLTAPEPAEVEAALRLNRSARRLIQANLTLLGHDTRGIDGVLGRGSRAAIAAWQRDEGHSATGYVTADQIDELDELAAARRAIQERDDRRYWNATGRSGDKDDLELYLERYPSGLFADEASTRLAEITADERRAADQDAWNFAVGLNSAQSYRDYLDDFPEGTYANVARRRVEELDPTPEGPDEDDSARAAEQRMNLNAATRLLIEGRLRGLGLNPGNVDGAFTSQTRDAIRQYQNRRSIPASGYLNAATVQALLLG